MIEITDAEIEFIMRELDARSNKWAMILSKDVGSSKQNKFYLLTK